MKQEPTSSGMFDLLLENIRDYAIIMVDVDGNVLSWSSGAEKIKGYKEDEIIGKNIDVFYPPEEVAGGRVKRELEIATRDGRYEEEGWRIRKDGSRFWANVVFTALRDADGELKGFAKITRDLTERKKSEDQMRLQTRVVLEMATVPVVEVWDGIVLVPLIGMLDSDRTQQLMEKLLNRLTATNSRIALVDITGVPAIDTQTAQHLVETVRAVRFVGSDVVLTGVRPVIAQTLVHLGVDLADVTTRSSLRAGLKVAFEMLGVRVAAINGN